MLVTTRSWLGKEDHDLEPALQGELTGILNWALAGLERLVVTNDNRFTHVEAGIEALGVMRDLASPVAAFVRDECETGPNREVEVDAVYSAYRTWCDDNGHSKATKQTVGGTCGPPSLRYGSSGRVREIGGRTSGAQSMRASPWGRSPDHE